MAFIFQNISSFKTQKENHLFWLHIFSFLLSFIVAGIVYTAWHFFNLPDFPSKSLGGHIAKPDGWLKFCVIALPLFCTIPSVLLIICQRIYPCQHLMWQKTIKRDIAANCITAFAWFTIPIFWAYIDTLAPYVGIIVIIWFLSKSIAILPWILRIKSLDFAHSICILLLLWSLLGGIAAWGSQTSTYSDAVKYMLFTHSLVEHNTFDLTETVKNREFKDFYWGRWHKEFVHATPEEINAPLLPFILYLPYAFGERLGILLFFSLLVSATAIFTAKSIVNFSLSNTRNALLVSFVGMSSCPVFFLSHVEFPDIIGLFLFSISFYICSIRKYKPLKKLIIICIISALAFLCKYRLIIGFAGIIFSVFYCWMQQFIHDKAYRRVTGLCLTFLLFFILSVLIHRTGLWSQYHWYAIVSSNLKGLFLGQNFGLFIVAPVFMLSAISFFEAFSKSRPFFHLCFFSIAISIFLFIGRNWFAWHGGFSPPYRYLMFTLPAWSALLIFWLSSEKRWRKFLFLLLTFWGSLYTAIGLIFPYLKTNRPVGPNRLFLFIEEYINIPLHSYLPSAFMHIGNIDLWCLMWLCATVSLVLLIILPQAAAKNERSYLGLRTPVATSFIIAFPFAVFCILLLFSPPTPRIVEAEMMTSGNASIWSPTNPLHLRGRVYLDESTSKATVTIRNNSKYSIGVRYIAQENGRITISFSDTKTIRLPLIGTATAKTREIDKRQNPHGLLRGKFKGRIKNVEKQIFLKKGTYNIQLRYSGKKGRENWSLIDYIYIKEIEK